jgi:hypothetical protein
VDLFLLSQALPGSKAQERIGDYWS